MHKYLNARVTRMKSVDSACVDDTTLHTDGEIENLKNTKNALEVSWTTIGGVIKRSDFIFIGKGPTTLKRWLKQWFLLAIILDVVNVISCDWNWKFEISTLLDKEHMFLEFLFNIVQVDRHGAGQITISQWWTVLISVVRFLMYDFNLNGLSNTVQSASRHRHVILLSICHHPMQLYWNSWYVLPNNIHMPRVTLLTGLGWAKVFCSTGK